MAKREIAERTGHRDRIEDLGGTFKLASSPGHGTVLTLSVPWPATGGARQ